MRIPYKKMRLSQAKKDLIAQADTILNDYQQQGIIMNLRMLYYQLVSKNLIANKPEEYNRLGDVISDGRMCGLLDWDMLEDQTRFLRKSSYWDSPADIIASCANQFAIDLRANQPVRPELWVEKDALLSVISPTCKEHQLPYLSCRGYMSQSEMWASAERIQQYLADDKEVVILHMGDHDPSGIDMTRDIEERLLQFLAYNYCENNDFDAYDKENLEYARSCIGDRFSVKRIALTMSQIQQYNPPPNPVKKTDKRWKKYAKQTGLEESWELDALTPNVLRDLITFEVEKLTEAAEWEAMLIKQGNARTQLSKVADKWDKVVTYVNKFK